MMRTPESYERKDVEKYLDSIGAVHFHIVNRGFGSSGAPDLIACVNGVFVGIEVKREGKEPTAKQREKLMAVRNAGGMVFWGTAEKIIAEMVAWMP